MIAELKPYVWYVPGDEKNLIKAGSFSEFIYRFRRRTGASMVEAASVGREVADMLGVGGLVDLVDVAEELDGARMQSPHPDLINPSESKLNGGGRWQG